jgi:hypothetical protein
LLNELSGRFKIEAIKPDGSKRLVADWFSNEILNAGLDKLGTAQPILGCSIGTDATPVSVLQTSLVAPIAYSTATAPSGNTSGAVTYSPYYAWRRWNFRFAIGVAAGTLREVGVGWDSTNMFSRALIMQGGSQSTITASISSTTLTVTAVGSGSIVLGAVIDGPNVSSGSVVVAFLTGTGGIGTYQLSAISTAGSASMTSTVAGSPGSITILSDEILDVSYELRLYPPLTDVNGSVVIGGITYSTVVRAAGVGNTGYWGPGSGVNSYMRIYDYANCYSGSLGPITGNPTSIIGTNTNTVTFDTYVPGSYTCSATFNYSVNQQNDNISAVVFASYFGTRFQVSFSPPIPKDNTKTMTLSASISWARKTI